MAQDHYETLGVPHDASQDDIKRAYRKLARQYHPDANRDDPEAEERFKELGRAYEVLKDPDRRRRYDMFGDERVAAGGGGVGDFGDFGGISDLFSTFFGGGGGGTRTQRGPARGNDVLAEVEITLEEAATGVERDVEVTTLSGCPECGGVGAAPGTRPSPCPDCGGTGEVRAVRRTLLGNVMTAATCLSCRGTGETIRTPCPMCRGQGRVPVNDNLTVQIPAGIEDGAQLRVSGRGESGMRGGRAGDLYIAVEVLEHDVFKRAAADIGCEVDVPLTVAALGGEIEVPTLIEDAETLEVKPGTQSGEVVRLRNKGMPRQGGRGRGEQVVLLRVQTPTDLDDDQAALLVQLARLRGEEVDEKHGWFERIKEAFQ